MTWEWKSGKWHNDALDLQPYVHGRRNLAVANMWLNAGIHQNKLES